MRALADAIGAVLQDADLRQRLITAAALRAKRFTWDETARVTSSVLERLV